MIRIADFGQSEERELKNASNKQTSLAKTIRKGGTAIYNAPERFEDSESDSEDDATSSPAVQNKSGSGSGSKKSSSVNQQGMVAKSSRKTDIYSFAMLAWEILCVSDKLPFGDVKSDFKLRKKVRKGERPLLADLPIETPPSVMEMIDSCWSQDRSRRKTAVECYSILNHAYELMRLGVWDIFFSHPWVNKPFLHHVYRILTQSGFRVWFDQNEMGYDLQHSMRAGIANSKVVVVCASKEYQKRPNCMFELDEARRAGKLVVVLVIDENIFNWANVEMKTKCELSTKMFVGDENVNGKYTGVSSLSKVVVWDAEESQGGPSKALLDQLRYFIWPFLYS